MELVNTSWVKKFSPVSKLYVKTMENLFGKCVLWDIIVLVLFRLITQVKELTFLYKFLVVLTVSTISKIT